MDPPHDVGRERRRALLRRRLRLETTQSEAGINVFALAGQEAPVAGMSQGADTPAWSVTFAVQDADETATRAEELGGELARPVEDTPWGRMGAVRDPEGAEFGVAAMAG